MEPGSGIVKFNVGGTPFDVFQSTLKTYPQSILWKLVCGELRSIVDETGAIYLDRNPTSFSKVLDLMRYQIPMVDESEMGIVKAMIKADIEYYHLHELLKYVVTEQEEIALTDIEVQVSNLALSASLVDLNVGGTHYTTSINTLLRFPDSMLGTMFSGPIASSLSSDGRVFIDRDGALFRHVLNFMRTGQLSLPPTSPDLDALAREADFFQIPELVYAVDKAKEARRLDRLKGTYLEVKDSIICFRGFHISTSLIGPMRVLARVSPFKEEFHRTGPTGRDPEGNLSDSSGPSLWCNLNPFYTAWSKGCIEEVYLNSDNSISRLEWAVKLREAGWQLVNTSSCCSSVSDQTYIVVDKWFLSGDITESPRSDVGQSDLSATVVAENVPETRSTEVQTGIEELSS